MRKHLKHLKTEKGFTLIELLAVIVILGIIAAIAVPMIGNVIQDSERKAEVNDAINIISAAKLADANGETPEKDATAVVTGKTTHTFDAGDLSKYLESTSGFTSVVKIVDDTSVQWAIEGHEVDEYITEGPDGLIYENELLAEIGS